MNFRLFTEADYPMVSEWWRKRKWEPVEPGHLSTYGIIVSEGQDICAGWLFLTNSKFAWIEWCVTNPDAPMRLKKSGLEYLLDVLSQEAKALGAESVVAWLRSRGLIKLYQRVGFNVTDREMIGVLKRIGGTACVSQPLVPSSVAD